MPAREGILVLLLLVFAIENNVRCYTRSPCTRSVRPQFQFPDCYVPNLDPSLLLSEASFLMSHDAATGYMPRNKPTWWYAQNQVGGIYDQLQDGARAFDLRPKLLENGTVIFQHDVLNIPVSLQQLVGDAVQWCNENPTELVLLLSSNYLYESTNNTNMFGSMTAAYQELGVPYLHCNDVYGMTVAEVMQLSTLQGGGYLLAMDGQDYYGPPCYKQNWAQDRLVTCYTKINGTVTACTSSREPLEKLQLYVMQSANNDPTDDASTLGPSSDLYNKPLTFLQAFWQVSPTSAAAGMAHFSTLLQDNQKSRVNERMMELIHSGALNQISLFGVDNVAVNGNALLSVLRTSCSNFENEICGSDLAQPKLRYFHYSWIGVGTMLAVFVLAFGFALVMICSRNGIEPPKIVLTAMDRINSVLLARNALDSDRRRDGLLQES